MALLWWNVAFDEPLPVFIETTTGATKQDILSSHPGAYAIEGPWLIESDATKWLSQHAKPAFGGHGTWPPAPPGSPPPSGGGGSGSAPWWVIVLNGTGHVEQSTGTPPTPPGAGSEVLGPYKTQAQARLADLNHVAGGDPSSPGGTWWVIVKGTTSTDLTARVVQASARPATPAGAMSQVLGPYASKADAELADLNAIGKSTAKGGIAPGLGGLSGVNAIGNFFNKIGDRATWVRIAKVAIGAIMIIAGLVRLGVPAAEKIAAKLPPVVPV